MADTKSCTSAFNWYCPGRMSVAGAVPFATSANPADQGFQVDLTGLTADQQIQAGLFCGNVFPAYKAPLTSCPGNLYGSTLVKIPKAGTENDDHNPPRIQPRDLFDVAVGDDDLFHGGRYKWSLRFTVINQQRSTTSSQHSAEPTM